MGVYSSLYGSLAASGSLEVPTAGTASATSQGWCNVTSPGSGPNPSTEPKNDVAAFAIFAYAPTGQQVSVPAGHWFLQNADNSLILAYDNTNGYNYGVALADSNIYTYVGQPNDTVNVFIADQSGNQIITDSFPMVPASHLSFVLTAADHTPPCEYARHCHFYDKHLKWHRDLGRTWPPRWSRGRLHFSEHVRTGDFKRALED